MKEIILILFSTSLLFLMLSIRTRLISGLTNFHFYLFLIIGYLSTRIILLILMFMVFNREGPGDLIDVFYYEALLVKNGNMIYKDFVSSYSLLFPYLLSLPLYLWNNPLSIIFLFVVLESAVLIIATKYIIPKFKINVREFLWLFIFCPINIIFTVFYVQDEIVLAFFMVAAFALIIDNKKSIATFVLILGFYFTKLISLYFFIPLLFMMQKKYVFIFSMFFIGGNLLIYSMGIDLLVPLRESGFQAIGPNIWSIFENIGININAKLAYLILLIITGFLIIVQIISQYFTKSDPNTFLNFILIYSLAFMSFSKKSFSFYFLIIIVFYLIKMINTFKDSEENASRFLTKITSKQGITLLYLFLLSILYSYEKIGYQESFNLKFAFSNGLILTTLLLQFWLLYQYLAEEIRKNIIRFNGALEGTSQ